MELEELIGLVKERLSFVRDIWQETDFFFRAPETFDREVIRKRWKPETPGQLNELKEVLDSVELFTPAATEQAVKSWIEKKGYSTGAVMNAFRLVIVGASRGPHLFDIIAWIGKEETIKRIDRGIVTISEQSQ